MSKAIKEYRNTVNSAEFKERQRMREKAAFEEKVALANAEKRGEERGKKKYERRLKRIIAKKDKAISKLEAEIAALKAMLESKEE